MPTEPTQDEMAEAWSYGLVEPPIPLHEVYWAWCRNHPNGSPLDFIDSFAAKQVPAGDVFTGADLKAMGLDPDQVCDVVDGQAWP